MSADVGFDPRDGTAAGSVAHTTIWELDAAVARAENAAIQVARTPPVRRRGWLYAIANALEEHASELVRIADRETALGEARLAGEVARAAGQLRFYGDVASEGSYLGATIDHATVTTSQLAKVNIPLGPVAVFGASNFPFAFSVLGNDTASAIAAGCPVVVKAHPAHPLLSQKLARLAQHALDDIDAPHGTFELVTGYDVGAALVRHRGIAAVAFTGSQAGGMALWRLANQRETVIPVFAEMGTVNPVVVTPAARHAMKAIAAGFVASFTLGSGQYCTKPGLIFAPRGASAPALIAEALKESAPEPLMLTESIATSVRTSITHLQHAGATVVEQISASEAGWSAPAAILTASLESIRSGSRLLAECFGPVAIVVEYDSAEDVVVALAAMQGALAASLFTGENDDVDAAAILTALMPRVGRVVVNDWPTGVAYDWAQQHGGPWPATSNPAATSVGAAALSRFLRPIAYQNVPENLLPAPLTAANPWRVPQRIDGTLQMKPA